MHDAQIYSVSMAWILSHTASVATALIVLVAGWYLARILSHRASRLLGHSNAIDNTLRPLIVELVRYGILAITAVVVLGQFGVQTASMLAVLGAVGLAIALALQGTLSNIAAGLMLLWLRPFNVGEYIDAEGIAGTVVRIDLFSTRLRTYDGIYTFAPNSKLWNAKIINYSREPTRMIEFRVGIAYGADIARARQTFLDLAKDERVLETPAPFAFVAELNEGAVVMALRVWVNGSNWWAVKTDFTERTKLALDAAGIEIPFNKLYAKNPTLPDPMGPRPDDDSEATSE